MRALKATLAAAVTSIVLLSPIPSGAAGTAGSGDYAFDMIDGGTLDLHTYLGRPLLVANTASLCAYTPQYDGLQALYDQFRDRGLVVLAVPSEDFRQELGSEAEVREFCAMNFNLDLPMTALTHVTGDAAHPFFRWLADDVGFVPGWNFNKVLIGGDGSVLGTWGAPVDPLSPQIVLAVEAALAG